MSRVTAAGWDGLFAHFARVEREADLPTPSDEGDAHGGGHDDPITGGRLLAMGFRGGAALRQTLYRMRGVRAATVRGTIVPEPMPVGRADSAAQLDQQCDAMMEAILDLFEGEL